MSQRNPNSRRVVRQFHVVWVRPPSEELIIEAGARALRLHAERQAARQAAEQAGTEDPTS